MRLVLTLLLAPLLHAEPAPPVDVLTPIQRYLVSLRLGDTLEDVKKIYPPSKKWPTSEEPGSNMIRVDVRRENARTFPDNVSFMRLSLKNGRLARIVLIYDKHESRRRSLDRLVRELSLQYGEPRRRGPRYWWQDQGAVILAVHAEILSKSGKARELRPSLELMDLDAFHELYD
jgi:hypothetical protein